MIETVSILSGEQVEDGLAEAQWSAAEECEMSPPSSSMKISA